MNKPAFRWKLLPFLFILGILMTLPGCNLVLYIYDELTNNRNDEYPLEEGSNPPEQENTNGTSAATIPPTQSPVPSSGTLPTPVITPEPTPNTISRIFRLDTTATGANVNTDVINFPLTLQIRNLDILAFFGSEIPEIYFTLSDGATLLEYGIEYFSSTDSVVIIRVLLPVVKGNDNTDYIIMNMDNTKDGQVNGITNVTESTIFKAADGYQGVWHLNENSDTPQVKDAMNLHEGTMNENTNLHSVPGIIGKALSFNDNYINCGKGGGLDNMASMTWSAWIYPEYTGDGRILDKSTGYYGPALATGVGVNALYFSGDFSSTFLRRSSADNSISLNKWNFVTIVWNGSPISGNVKLYVNGLETLYGPPVEGSGTIINNSSADFFIGNRSGGADMPFKGLIDEVIVSGTMWNPAMIKLTYENQKENQTLVSDPVIP